MWGIDSLRILRPLHSARGESTVKETYSNDGHSEHPELESDENDVYEGGLILEYPAGFDCCTFSFGIIQPIISIRKIRAVCGLSTHIAAGQLREIKHLRPSTTVELV